MTAATLNTAPSLVKTPAPLALKLKWGSRLMNGLALAFLMLALLSYTAIPVMAADSAQTPAQVFLTHQAQLNQAANAVALLWWAIAASIGAFVLAATGWRAAKLSERK